MIAIDPAHSLTLKDRQRLQMIHLIAQDIQDLTSSMATAAGAPASWKNVAIGLLSEPAFINKDKVIRRYLSEHQRSARGEDVSFKLCWLVGTDTVERFFDQKCACPACNPSAATCADQVLNFSHQTILSLSTPVFRPSSLLEIHLKHLRNSSTSPAQLPPPPLRPRPLRHPCTNRPSRLLVCPQGV